MTPVYGYLVLSGWHGCSTQRVEMVGVTPHRFRIRAITRTRLAGRNRWLEPGETTLVPKHAVRHGEWSVITSPQACVEARATRTGRLSLDSRKA